MQLHSVALAFTDPPPVADALVDEGYLTCMQLRSVALAFTDPSPRTEAVVKVSAPQVDGVPQVAGVPQVDGVPIPLIRG